MKFFDFNKSIEDKLYKVRDEKDSDIYLYLSNFFSEYKKQVESELFNLFKDEFKEDEAILFYNDNKKLVSSKIDYYCDNILLALDCYLHGDIKNAVDHIKNILNDDYFFSPYSSYLPIDINMYRIRKNDLGNPFFRINDMFHIPFEKRYLVSPQRFSINGFPCLYAGDSIFVSWLEMNMPNLEDFFVSRLRMKDIHLIYSLLDLRWPNHSYIYQEFHEDRNAPKHYILLYGLLYWPLIIACSIKVLHPLSPFKPEYIIPQLTMLSLIDTRYIGCAYTSTKISNEFSWSERCTNYVFTARSKDISSGYSDVLKSLFTITEPICYKFELIKSTFDKYKSKKQEKEVNSYEYTTFGLMEKILADKELKQIV